jgi:hypothetical protein
LTWSAVARLQQQSFGETKASEFISIELLQVIEKRGPCLGHQIPEFRARPVKASCARAVQIAGGEMSLTMPFVPSSSTVLDFRSYYVLQHGGWCCIRVRERRLDTSTIASGLGTHVDHLHVLCRRLSRRLNGGFHTFTNRERRSADGYKYVANR